MYGPTLIQCVHELSHLSNSTGCIVFMGQVNLGGGERKKVV